MLKVAAQIVFCLALAAALGFAAAWLIQSLRLQKRLAAAEDVPPSTDEVQEPEPPVATTAESDVVATPAAAGTETHPRILALAEQLASAQAALEKLLTSYSRIEAELAEHDRAVPPTEPESAPTSSSAALYSGAQPRDLSQQEDDLKLILGIGPALERTLNEMGVRTFRQIAAWTEAEVNDMAARLGSFGSRIKRDNWVRRAKEQHYIKYGENV